MEALWSESISVSIYIVYYNKMHIVVFSRIPFVTYLFFLAFLTTAFVLGSTKAGSPSEYSQPIDGFRLFCEIVVLLLIIIEIVIEMKEL